MARTNTIQQRFATLLVIAIAVSGSLVAARPLRILLEEGAGVATVAKGGSFDVTVSETSAPGHKALLFEPQGDRPVPGWPAIVYAHGLCGGADLYKDTLKHLASFGYVIVANKEQESCRTANPSNPIGSTFAALDTFHDMSDGKTMVSNLKAEVEWLRGLGNAGVEDNGLGIDGSKVALVGHSMGGGAVIDLAADLATSDPDAIAAVLAIAPWNGINNVPRPSDVSGAIKAPLLLICSTKDQICPCSGPFGSDQGIGARGIGSIFINGWATMALRVMFGPGHDLTWHGGVDAIFMGASARPMHENGTSTEPRNVTLVSFNEGGHFGLAGITNESDLDNLMVDALGQSGVTGGLASAAAGTAIGMTNQKDAEAVAEDTMGLTVAFLAEHLAGVGYTYNGTAVTVPESPVSFDDVLGELQADDSAKVERAA